MSTHAQDALDALDRVGNVDRDGDRQVDYLLVSAIVSALLEVADAVGNASDR